MKVSMIALATALALSSTYAMAQNGPASPATRSAMNSIHATYRVSAHHRGWSASRYNGHGINNLGVTTNQGRKYNG
jgi:hypothetical protein